MLVQNAFCVFAVQAYKECEMDEHCRFVRMGLEPVLVCSLNRCHCYHSSVLDSRCVECLVHEHCALFAEGRARCTPEKRCMDCENDLHCDIELFGAGHEYCYANRCGCLPDPEVHIFVTKEYNLCPDALPACDASSRQCVQCISSEDCVLKERGDHCMYSKTCQTCEDNERHSQHQNYLFRSGAGAKSCAGLIMSHTHYDGHMWCRDDGTGGQFAETYCCGTCRDVGQAIVRNFEGLPALASSNASYADDDPVGGDGTSWSDGNAEENPTSGGGDSASGSGNSSGSGAGRGDSDSSAEMESTETETDTEQKKPKKEGPTHWEQWLRHRSMRESLPPGQCTIPFSDPYYLPYRANNTARDGDYVWVACVEGTRSCDRGDTKNEWFIKVRCIGKKIELPGVDCNCTAEGQTMTYSYTSQGCMDQCGWSSRNFSYCHVGYGWKKSFVTEYCSQKPGFSYKMNACYGPCEWMSTPTGDGCHCYISPFSRETEPCSPFPCKFYQCGKYGLGSDYECVHDVCMPVVEETIRLSSFGVECTSPCAIYPWDPVAKLFCNVYKGLLNIEPWESCSQIIGFTVDNTPCGSPCRRRDGVYGEWTCHEVNTNASTGCSPSARDFFFGTWVTQWWAFFEFSTDPFFPDHSVLRMKSSLQWPPAYGVFSHPHSTDIFLLHESGIVRHGRLDIRTEVIYWDDGDKWFRAGWNVGYISRAYPRRDDRRMLI